MAHRNTPIPKEEAVMENVGYVRVSSLDQKTDRQFSGVELDRVFEDKASAADVKRPQLVPAWSTSGRRTCSTSIP